MIDIENEFRLARQMKDAYCNESGKEIKAAKAAEIIHKIGAIYRKRSPDKISLIKSVGLLNAALVRNPSNRAQIKYDLSEACQHVLKQAKARNQNANLVARAKQVKISVKKMRNEVEAKLKMQVLRMSENDAEKYEQAHETNKISAIQQINKSIAKMYKQIMANESRFCEDVMGVPPCEYAIVGMGSLAREEITPYSDVEHMILLCDKKNYELYLEYFKWYSVIFHIIILNVQETIIPSLNISSLNGKDAELGNWYYDAITPRGISFDGMMPHACKFPLGRLEHCTNKQINTGLIKPVSEMLEYLTFESNLKNGYHLADILTKTCFVFGNEDIFRQFACGTQNFRNKKSKIDSINDVQQQVKDDLNSFSTRFRLTNLKSQNTINIKQLVYRSTTVFIAALARIHNISANSSFDVVDEMVKNNIITNMTAHKLRYAISFACEVRLRVYTKYKSQRDNAIDLKQSGIAKFLEIVGIVSTINYFQIAYCLQCEIAKQLNFTKLHFYSDPQLINITIGLAFGKRNMASFSQRPQKLFWDSSKFDFDLCIQQLESEIKESANNNNLCQRITDKMFTIFDRNIKDDSYNLNTQQIKYIADYLYSAEIFDEALEFYKELSDMYMRELKTINPLGYEVTWSSLQIGLCLMHLAHYTEALKYLNQVLKIRQNITINADKDNDIATTLNHIGLCHIELHNYDDALISLHRAQQIYLNTTREADRDRGIAMTLHNIGWCHIGLHNYYDAMTYLNQALEIQQKASLNVVKDRNIAATLHNISYCYIDLHSYNEAFAYLHQALRIEQNTTLDENRDRDLALVQSSIGRYHTGLQHYNDSWNCLKQSLKVLQNTTLDEGKDRSIANTYNYMGECLIGKQEYANAIAHLEKALKIYQTITTKAEKDTRIAKTLYNIGLCLKELHEYENAQTYFKQSLNIYEQFSQSEYISSKVMTLRFEIDICLLKSVMKI